jgi:exodeoxyribonuclease V gamma subunit
LKALESLLNVSGSNFNAETVLQLLDFSCIKKKFGIQNTELVGLIVEKALFRFGIEGVQDDDSYLYSLSNSIKKIVLGISLKIEGTYDELYPIDIIEGFDSEEALKFCVFADALVEMLKNRGNSPKSLLEWTTYVDDVAQQFLFVDNEEDEKELRHQAMIVKQLGNFYLVSDPSYCSEEISWNIFVNSFIDVLGKDRRTKRYVSNGITFCSHIPMRSLPYKMVCMLGLDYDKFPRKDRKLSFSKISGTEKGDRRVRENDKHLFLESLMSAKDYFYLSYIGNSSKDNTNIPSSVLVEELITYIADRSVGNDIAKKLVTRHPLHAFSKNYNKVETPNLVSYLIDNQTQNIPMKPSANDKADVLGEATEVDVIKFGDLISFFKNPIKYYYNKVLKIYYEDQDTLIKVTEMFEMDKLEEWKLKDSLMDLDDMELLDSRDLIIKGELPSKNMGIAYSEHFKNKISGLHFMYWSLRNAALEQEGADEYKEYNNNLNLDQHTIIEGKLDNLFNNQLLGYSLSSNPRSRKNLIELYIQYLFLRALNVEVNATFLKINSSNKNIETYPIVNQLTNEEALSLLKELVSIFKEGQKRIIPFYPDLVLTINKEFLDENGFKEKLDTNLEKLLNTIEDYFDDNKFDK